MKPHDAPIDPIIVEQASHWLMLHWEGPLDAMQQHRNARSFAKAYARDRARFLRNWPADSQLFKLLNQRIPLTPAVGSAD